MSDLLGAGSFLELASPTCRGRGSTRKFKNKKGEEVKDGFKGWGGYMAAKRAKLIDQFHSDNIEKISDIFSGVKIMVNGLTHPSAVELKNLMAAHGGEYHMYQVSSTTHIIASNLPNVKIKHLGAVPIVKPAWIVESIALNKLLDYKRYLLYNNQTKSQPALNFPVIPKPSTSTSNKEATFESKEELNAKVEVFDSNMQEETCKIYTENGEDNNSTIPNTKIQNISNSGASNIPLPTSNSRITKTASDPKFLEEFYSNSRLHLISTLGAEFKQLVGQLREKSNGKFPGRERLLERGKSTASSNTPSSVIMHIDMDCFFVSVGLRNHPELKGKPVAITHAKNGVINSTDPNRQAAREKEFQLYQERLPEGASSRIVDIKDKIDGLASMSEIASCSYEARQFGIKNGMFLGQAVKLCPDLKTLPYDFEGYKEVSNLLYNTVASYTLDIEAVSCDEMYVDIKKVLADTGLTVEEWGTHIRNEIMSVTGCPCSTGFGANRLQARLATKKAKPAGQYYLKPQDVDSYMSDIALSDLPGVGRATLAKLQNLGLSTCGDVQVASLKVLQSELGLKLGEKIRDQAFGRDSKPLDFNHERKSVSAEINYGIRFKTKEECYNFLQSLAVEVFNRLSDVNMKAKGLTLKLLVRAEGAPVETAKFLGHGVCDAITKSSTSNVTYSSSDIIFKEAKSIYDKLNLSFAELRGVGIQLTKLEKRAPVNKALSNFLKQGSSKKTGNVDQSIKLQAPLDKNVDQKSNVTSGEKSPLQPDKDQLSMNTSNKNPEENVDNRIDIKEVKKLSIATNSVKIDNVKKSKGDDPNASVKPKGRGRPRGSKNSMAKSLTSKTTSKKEVGRIDNFLGKARKSGESIAASNEPDVDNAELAKIRDEIDINVLNELPEDIKNEIMREYKFDLKAREADQKVVMSKEIHVERKLKETQEERILTQSRPTASKQSPFSNLSWDQLKPVLKTWIHSESVPSEIDVEMLASHLRELAIARKIEVLQTAFNFLHRVLSDQNCAWHQAYFSLVNAVQLGMVARYGKVLLIENDFSCCKIQ